jgi:Uma2 family endonuclease
MRDVARIWTREEVLALPDDGNRYELIDGHLLVSPSPRAVHQLALAELFHLVDGYVRAHRIGVTAWSPADLDLGLGDVAQPDLFVVPQPDRPAELGWRGVGVPLLVIEVLSPSTARSDRITKRYRYRTAGVRTYWIVDLDASVVEVWTPGVGFPSIADRVLRWQPDPTVVPLEIDLEQFFRVEWRNAHGG